MTSFQIGELARRFDIPVETIRYYERIGLLPEPMRSDGNYRRYSAAHADQLAFVLNCRGLDMTQEEIRRLLALRADPARGCEDVNGLVDGHIEQTQRRIEELTRLLADLRALRRACSDDRTAHTCEIIAELATAKRRAVRRPRC